MYDYVVYSLFDADGEVTYRTAHISEYLLRSAAMCWHDSAVHADMCCKLLSDGKNVLWQAMHDELKEKQG